MYSNSVWFVPGEGGKGKRERGGERERERESLECDKYVIHNYLRFSILPLSISPSIHPYHLRHPSHYITNSYKELIISSPFLSVSLNSSYLILSRLISSHTSLTLSSAEYTYIHIYIYTYILSINQSINQSTNQISLPPSLSAYPHPQNLLQKKLFSPPPPRFFHRPYVESNQLYLGRKGCGAGRGPGLVTKGGGFVDRYIHNWDFDGWDFHTTTPGTKVPRKLCVCSNYRCPS